MRRFLPLLVTDLQGEPPRRPELHVSSQQNQPQVSGGGVWSSPVHDAAHVNLQVAVVSQQPLLHLDQVHRSVVQSQEAHTALEEVKGVVTVLATVLCWTALMGEKAHDYSEPTPGNLEPHKSR